MAYWNSFEDKERFFTAYLESFLGLDSDRLAGKLCIMSPLLSATRSLMDFLRELVSFSEVAEGKSDSGKNEEALRLAENENKRFSRSSSFDGKGLRANTGMFEKCSDGMRICKAGIRHRKWKLLSFLKKITLERHPEQTVW